MRKRELDHLLEKAVADALGLSLPPLANTHRKAYGKPHHANTRRHTARPVVITTRYERVPAHA